MFLRRFSALGLLGLAAHFTATTYAAEIFPENTPWRYLKGTQEASSPNVTTWRTVGFDDTGWLTGSAPFFYDDGTGYSGNTALPDMRNGYTCIFMRKEFQVVNPASDIELDLAVRSDDGCIVWINGVEMLRVNMPAGTVGYNGTSLGSAGEPNVANLNIPDAANFLVPGANVIAIQAFNASLGGSSDFLIAAALSSTLDAQPPQVSLLIPPATATVRQLFQIEVFFDEPVTNVDAADLRINGVPAESLAFGGPGQFIFEFPQPPTGTVAVAWAPGHGITDLSSSLNPFAGGSWTYTLDPNAEPPGVILSEFMASNDETLNDEDGDSSDWIELFNAGTVSANLNGWSLTDDPEKLTKWRFPAVTLLPNSYMVVFASGKNKRSPTGTLHTDFQLTASGEYLALVDDLTNVVSEFAPVYPAQQTDVSYGRDRANPTVVGYFLTPTPGSQNTPGGLGFAPEVMYSHPSRTFTSAFSLALSVEPSHAGAVIHYTLDNSIPTQASPVYSSPLLISETARVRTRAFETGLLPGPVRSGHYIRLDSSVAGVTSDLPLMILHNYGGGSVPSSGEQFVVMQIFERQAGGRSALANTPELDTRGRFRLRGSSTQGIAKGSYAFEAWDEYNDDKDIAPLGMPPESDWVLYAPNQFDPVLIHNSFMYELSNEVGRYASRTRFVELYLKDNSGTPGALTGGDYNGVYLLIEKVKRDRNRVDIDNLEPEHVNPPEVTGGYLLKIDRADPGDSGFGAAGQTVLYVDPKEQEIELPQRDPQQQYIINFITQFGAALNGPNYTDPELGYAAFVDVLSLVDHHILNVLSENADAFRLSTYFYKPRNNKLEYGPIWDFDRSLESAADSRDNNPSVWHDGGTDFFNYTWFGRMLSDPNFWQVWIDRWQDWQDGPLNITNLHAKIDRMAGELREAQVREQARWPGITTPRGGYQNEVNIMKNWLASRVTFINSEFLARPVFSHPGGDISAGQQLTLLAPEGGTLYYTIEGTDPRGPDSLPSPGAMIYTGPITLVGNSRVLARAFDVNHDNLSGGDNPRVSSHWSGKTEALFVVARPELIITEIMYHPAPAPAGDTNAADNFEFIELKNIGGAPMNLNGVRFINGITFDFTDGAVPLLQPGQRVVVVKNLAAFTSRYGAVPNVVGPYEGSLDNGGERLVLVGRVGEPIHDFSYNDAWYPVTDGEGFSLVIAHEDGPRGDWDRKSGWRISRRLGGTPGAEDAPPPGLPWVRINEALTHTDLPDVDAIELHNPGPAEADVSGWFLTDSLANPRQYVIPAGTRIAAGGYFVLRETNFNAFPGLPGNFLLSSKGEVVYLFSGDGAALTGYAHGFEFGAAANGVSFGRHVLSTGEEEFPAQQSNTLGGPNTGPRIGPVVISEIMYHPAVPAGSSLAEDLEFIELKNIGSGEVPLFDPNVQTNTWKLEEAVDFTFPMNVSMPAGSHVLVVGFDPMTNTTALAGFRGAFGVGPTVPIYGPFQGRLDNAGDRVELTRPDTPEPPSSPEAGTVPYILVDQVRYADASPWPLAADGVGFSLQRMADNVYGNDPASWVAAAPTAGAPYPGGVPLQFTLQPVSQVALALSDVTFRVVVSGAGPFHYQWRFNGTNLEGATNDVLTLRRVQPGQAGSYQVVVLNSAISASSQIASLVIRTAATILKQPESVQVWPGADVTFTIQASSSTPITYQWRKDGQILPGATGPSLSLFNVQEADDGFYEVLVTDGIGTIPSDPARLAVLVAPAIVVPPQPQSVTAGDSLTLSVQSTGTLPMSYRWRRGNQTLTNTHLFSHQSFLTVPVVTTADGGNYTVVLTNLASVPPGLLSPAALVTVLADSDGDGMADTWESANGFNPLDGTDGNLDADGDGMTNLEEHRSGTDPHDKQSYLRIEQISLQGGVRLEFVARSGKTYTVLHRALAEEPTSGWQKLKDVPAGATDQLTVVIDSLGTPHRVYRLVTPMQE